MAVIFKDQTAASLDDSVQYISINEYVIKMVWYSLYLTCEWDWLQNIGCNLPSIKDFYRMARTSVTNHIVGNTSFSHYISQDLIQSLCTTGDKQFPCRKEPSSPELYLHKNSCTLIIRNPLYIQHLHTGSYTYIQTSNRLYAYICDNADMYIENQKVPGHIKIWIILKGLVHPKMKISPWFTHPQGILGVYDSLSLHKSYVSCPERLVRMTVSGSDWRVFITF